MASFTLSRRSCFQANKDRFNLWGGRENGKGFRECQLGAYWAVWAHFTTTNEPALVSLPTGAGKTALMMALSFGFEAERVLIITPAQVIRDQIATEFESLDILKKIEVVTTGIAQPPEVLSNKNKLRTPDDWGALAKYDVVTATPKTTSPDEKGVCRPPEGLFDLVFLDEAHHAPAPTWAAILKVLKGTKCVLLTATPFRRDKRRIRAPLVYHYPIAKAIEEGIYRPIKYHPVESNFRRPARDKALCKVAKEVFDQETKRAEEKELAKPKLLIRTDRVEWADRLVRLYNENDGKDDEKGDTKIEVRAVDYTRPWHENKDTIQALRDDELDGLVCVGMIGEGLDLPKLKIAVLHSAPRSLPFTLQLIGRVSRFSDKQIGKAHLIAAPDEVQGEMRRLYISDKEWRELIPGLADEAIGKVSEFRDFGSTYAFEELQIKELDINLLDLRPFLSVCVYKVDRAKVNLIDKILEVDEEHWPEILKILNFLATKIDEIDREDWPKILNLLTVEIDEKYEEDWPAIRNLLTATMDKIDEEDWHEIMNLLTAKVDEKDEDDWLEILNLLTAKIDEKDWPEILNLLTAKVDKICEKDWPAIQNLLTATMDKIDEENWLEILNLLTAKIDGKDWSEILSLLTAKVDKICEKDWPEILNLLTTTMDKIDEEDWLEILNLLTAKVDGKDWSEILSLLAAKVHKINEEDQPENLNVTAKIKAIDEKDLPENLNLPLHEPLSAKYDLGVLITGLRKEPAWAMHTGIQEIQFDLHVFYYRKDRKLLFEATTSDTIAKMIRLAITGDQYKVSPISPSEVMRLVQTGESYFTVGLKNVIGRGPALPSYKTLMGAEVEAAVRPTDRKTFALGHALRRLSEKEVRGISTLRGRIWASKRDDLDEFRKWCDGLTDELRKPPIGPGDVPLELAFAEDIDKLLEQPLSVQLDHSLLRAIIHTEIIKPEDVEDDTTETSEPKTENDTTETEIGDIVPYMEIIKKFEKEKGELECEFCFHSEKPGIRVRYSASEEPVWERLDLQDLRIRLEFSDADIFDSHLLDYLYRFPPSLVMPTGGVIINRQHWKPIGRPGLLPPGCVEPITWSCDKGDEESIHNWLEEKLKNESSKEAIIIKDHRRGEIADFVVIEPAEEKKQITFYHCKAMRGKEPADRVEDAYEVLGQASRNGRWILSPRLMRDLHKRTQPPRKSPTPKGDDTILSLLADSFSCNAWKYQVVVVQPGFDCRKIAKSKKIYSLLVATYEWLSACEAEFVVWGS